MPFVALLLLLAPPPRTIDLPVRHLACKEGVEFLEGTRGLNDSFPYLSVRVPKAKRAVDLTPDNLRAVLDGKIESADAAYEAVRLFVAGVRVDDGGKLLAEAKKLKKELKHLPIELGREPDNWRRVVVRTEEGWQVGFFAYEMDRVLRLVRIDATVKADGAMRIGRKRVFEGPMTSWQTAVVDDEEGRAEGLRDQEEMRAEAELARRRYAAALRPKRNLATAFAIGRLRLTPKEIEDLWPGERRGVGSGLRLVAVDLDDGTEVFYDATVPTHPISYLGHGKRSDGPMRRGAVLHWLATVRE